MTRKILAAAASFVVGACLASGPLLVRAHLMNADELARGEQTMGPGFQTLLGLCAAPLGGTVALLLSLWYFKRSSRPSD